MRYTTRNLCLSAMSIAAILTNTSAFADVQIDKVHYQGWEDSYRMTNGTVEVVVVPAIGRIMRYAFVGDESPIWENQTWLGKTRQDAEPGEWANFGGDKNWAAPQSDWPKYQTRSWPPDFAFDGHPYEASVTEHHTLRMVSTVSQGSGLRVVRELTLAPQGSRLEIQQIFEKIEGVPCRVSIWSITQVTDADAIYMPLSETGDYVSLSEQLNPDNWQLDGGWLRVTRDSQKAAKAGAVSGEVWLAWVKENLVFRVIGSFDPQASYPDGGCDLEVYTNADPLCYSEMELLGPLVDYAVGDTHSYTIAWELERLPESLSAQERRQRVPPANR